MELNRDNYFSLEANQHYMSVSQLKGFLPAYEGCEARAMAELAGEYESPDKDAFDEGHYVHSWNEGRLEEFKSSNPQLYSSRGPTKGHLKSNFQHCNKMIETLASDPLVMKVLAGEKEVILTAEFLGMPWKVMLDSYQPDIGSTGVFADLKCLQKIDSKWWNPQAQAYENVIDHYGYNVQMAVYAEVERLAKGRKDWIIPHMVMITKQNPPDKEIIYFDHEAINVGLQIVANNINRVKAVKYGHAAPERCERCDYCRQTKRVKIRHYADLALY